MSSGLRYGWQQALPLTLGALALFVLVYRGTLMTMVGLWIESDTFSHGFLVFPAVAFLIYRMRDRLAMLQPRPSWLGLGALIGSLALWFVAHVGAVQVAEQFSFVFGLCAIAWALLGWRVTLALSFPMFFALFAVPFGDFIIPTLMQFTAWFVVKAVELSGIPVFREGYLLSIPRGDFEVAKACSGIRYLIASVSLGTFFSYITFTSWKKRAVFISAAVLLPIIANGLRAYGIVMIAHFSHMQLAVGMDHLVYGWVFFGIVMFLMFWIGGRHADEPPVWAAASGGALSSVAMPRVAGVALGVVASALVVPQLSKRALAAVDAPLPPAALPAAADGWLLVAGEGGDYLPDFQDANAVSTAVYERDKVRVTATVHTYTGGDRELVRAGNRFAQRFGHKVLRDQPMPLNVDGESWTIGRIDLLERGPRRSVLYWYQIGTERTPSSNAAKFKEWLARLSGKPTRRALVSVSVPVTQRDDVPPELLDFASAHARALERCIVAPSDTGCAVWDRGQ